MLSTLVKSIVTSYNEQIYSFKGTAAFCSTLFYAKKAIGSSGDYDYV